jgi:hypothetical protein
MSIYFFKIKGLTRSTSVANVFKKTKQYKSSFERSYTVGGEREAWGRAVKITTELNNRLALCPQVEPPVEIARLRSEPPY